MKRLILFTCIFLNFNFSYAKVTQKNPENIEADIILDPSVQKQNSEKTTYFRLTSGLKASAHAILTFYLVKNAYAHSRRAFDIDFSADWQAFSPNSNSDTVHSGLIYIAPVRRYRLFKETDFFLSNTILAAGLSYLAYSQARETLRHLFKALNLNFNNLDNDLEKFFDKKT